MMPYGTIYGGGRYGGFAHGGGSSSSSSNLSPLAPPFTVDRPLPKPLSSSTPTPTQNPLVDFTDQSHGTALESPSFLNWPSSDPLHSKSDFFSVPGTRFESVPPSNVYAGYGCSLSTTQVPHASTSPLTDAPLLPQSSTGLVDTDLCYPAYGSPSINDVSSACPYSGYDLLSNSHVVNLNDSSSDDYFESLSSAVEPTAYWGGAAWDDHRRSYNQPKLDGNIYSNDKYMDPGYHGYQGKIKYGGTLHGIDGVGREKRNEYSNTGKMEGNSFLGKNPKFIPTDYQTSTPASNSVVPAAKSPVLSVETVSSRKRLSSHYPSANDSTGTKSSAAVVIRSPVKDTSSFKNVDTGDGDGKDFAGNNSSAVKESLPSVSSKGKTCFDASLLSFHLQNDSCFYRENEEQRSNKTSSADVLDHTLGEKPRVQVPHISLEDFSIAVDTSKAFNTVDNCSKAIDPCIPAVDSPCWRGAPSSHFSTFEVYEIDTPQKTKIFEPCSDSSLQSPQGFPLTSNDVLNVSSEIPNQNSVHHDSGNLESCFAPSLKSHSDTDVLCGKGIDDAVIPKKDSSLSSESIGNSDREPHTEQQSLEKGMQSSKNNSLADVTNLNNAHDDCSSHVPLRAVEHVLNSPPSTEDGPAQLPESCGGNSKPKLYVQMLVNTIHSLSEVLLYNCSTDLCQLKEEDYEVVKNVIKNLNACILKNGERMTSTKESLISQRTASQFLEDSSKHDKVRDGNRLQVSGISTVGCLGGLEHQLVQKEKQNVGSGAKDEQLSGFVSGSSAADFVKDDAMTQAIKKVLAQNFPGEDDTEPQVLLYKNLWLEAEASLCAANYMARFNRIKIQLEKCNLFNTNDCSATPMVPGNTMVMEKVLSSKVSFDESTSKTFAFGHLGGPALNMSVPGLSSSILSRSSNTNDAMDRFDFLKCLVDNSDPMNTSAKEKLSSSKISPDPNKVCKMENEGTENTKSDVFIQDSSSMLSAASIQTDVEASVMERFHILQNRVNSTSSNVEKLLSEGFVDPQYADLRKYLSISKVRSEDSGPALQNSAANIVKDKLTVKEFQLFGQAEPMSQSQMINRLGNQAQSGWYDCSTSDWEHVTQEEFTGQNC